MKNKKINKEIEVKVYLSKPMISKLLTELIKSLGCRLQLLLLLSRI